MTTRLSPLLLIALAALSAQCGERSPTAPGTGILAYTVYGVSAAGTSYVLTGGAGYISANGVTAMTNGNGVATLAGIPLGTTSVVVGASHWFATKTVTVEVSGLAAANNASAPLPMKNDLILQSVSVDDIGPITSGVTLINPNTVHFLVQASSTTVTPTLTMVTMFNGVAMNWDNGYTARTAVSVSEFGTKIYDLSLSGYAPCYMGPITNITTNVICVPTTDTLVFNLKPAVGQLDMEVGLPFLITWVYR